MSQNLLESRWDETKDALMEGLKGSRRNTMGVILENTRKYLLAENASPGSTASGNIATLNRVILPVIRRVMPTVIANEIVGVQPMTGPVGQIHTLRVRYASTMTDQSAAATSVTAGEEALSPLRSLLHTLQALVVLTTLPQHKLPLKVTLVLPPQLLKVMVVVRSLFRS